MKNPLVSSALSSLALTLAACGSAPPPPPVVVTRTEVVPPEPEPIACTEEWVHMPVLIDFPTGGTEISAQNRRILEEIVHTAGSRDDIRRVRVEGHTDSCGHERDNQALSEQRALAVANELSIMGVPREMLETQGFGSRIPRGEEDCSGDQRITAQTNRRVEFTILSCREGTTR